MWLLTTDPNTPAGACRGRGGVEMVEVVSAGGDGGDMVMARNRCPYDIRKPLPLQESQGRQIVPADLLFNKDLSYLRGGSTDKKYTASTTKTKAARDFLLEIQTSYFLREIVVTRAYHKLYTFMEGDFLRLHLNDIEDMLLLVAQNKLNNLDGNVIVHLAVGLLRTRLWTATNQKRTRIMIKDINQVLLERRIMRRLEKFVGGRDYGTDYRLLQRTTVKSSNILRVIRIILVIMPEHQSDTESIHSDDKNPFRANIKQALRNHTLLVGENVNPHLMIYLNLEYNFIEGPTGSQSFLMTSKGKYMFPVVNDPVLLSFDRLQLELEEKQLSLKRLFEDNGRYWQEIKGDFGFDVRMKTLWFLRVRKHI
nr:hypothetical protein [Tanacetum cinerariifolium]